MLARTAIARYPTALSRSAPTGPHHSIHFRSKNHGRQPGKQRSPGRRRAGAQRPRPVLQGLFLREPERAALYAAATQGPQINLQVNVNAKQLDTADFEVDLTLEGNAKIGDKDVLFAFELLFGRVPGPEHPAGPAAPGHHDRVPAPALPLRPPDGGRCGAQRRLPAPLYRPDRLRGLYRQRASELRGSRAARPPCRAKGRASRADITRTCSGRSRPCSARFLLDVDRRRAGSRALCRGGRLRERYSQVGLITHGVQAAAGLTPALRAASPI